MKKTVKSLLALTLSVLLAVMPAAAIDTVKETFTSVGEGNALDYIESLYMLFETNTGTDASSATVVSGEGNQYLKLDGFIDVRSWDYFYDYILDFDIRCENYGNNGIFVRGEFPGALTKINPMNAGTTQTFNYYEWDWYAENGGKSGGSGIGGSGILIAPGKSGIRITVKKYAADGLTVTSESFDFDLPASADFDGFTNIKVTDDSKEIKIFCAGELVCKIALSSDSVVYDSVVYDSDGTDVAYFKSITIYDADGAEKGTVENTRVHYDGGQIAFTSRVSAIDIDNLSLTFGEGSVASDGKTETETTTVVQTEPSTTEPAGTQAETDASSATEPADSVTSDPGNAGSKGLSIKTKIILIAAAAVVVIVAVLAIVVKPKKKQ